MKLIRKWKNAIKDRVQQFVVRRNYGTDRPNVVQLPGSRTRVHIDPDDPRAWKILVTAPLFGRIARNQTYWRDACQRLAPTLALDIGLNFGECLFAAEYHRHTELHGFEANPRLKPYVKRSLIEHPGRDQMHVHFGLVAAQSGPDAEFYIDRRWSGGSTAISGLKPEEAGRYDVVKVPVISVDTVLAPRAASRPGGALVFKIDVEGYEFQVLQGMQRSLEAPRWSVGLIEFDTALLKKAGESMEAYWAFLQERFAVFAFVRSAKAKRVREWNELTAMFRHPEFHTDLLLVSGEGDERVDEFLRDWTVGKGADGGWDAAGRRRAA